MYEYLSTLVLYLQHSNGKRDDRTPLIEPTTTLTKVARPALPQDGYHIAGTVGFGSDLDGMDERREARLDDDTLNMRMNLVMSRGPTND